MWKRGFKYAPAGGVLWLLAVMLGVQACASSNIPIISATKTPFEPTTSTDIASLNQAKPFQGILQAPQGKYLLVVIWVEFSGSGRLPIKYIDFPGFDYTASTGKLDVYRTNISLTQTDWGILGAGESRMGSAGGGTTSQLTTLPNLPFSTTVPVFSGTFNGDTAEMLSVPVILMAVSKEGSLLLEIDGKKNVLAKGENWQHVVEADLKAGQFNGHFRVVSSITNYGWNDRMQIKSKP